MTANEAKAPGPGTWVSVTVLVLGLVIGAVGAFLVILPLVRTFTTPSFATPGTSRLHLSHGTYLVYERTASSRFGLPGDTTTTVSADDVVVRSETGATAVPVHNRFGAIEELNRDGSTYVGAVEFDVPSSGTYTVTVNSTTPGRVIVARPLTDTVFANAEWSIAVVLGALLTISGIVMWIVGASRRRRYRAAYAYYGAPPAAWYPDPQQPGRLRYWDGTTWTEHVH